MGEKFMSYHSDPLIRDYEDRGMAKWMGFYLGEHTAEMTKEKAERETFWKRRPLMSESEISGVLEEAYVKRQEITVQFSALDPEGQVFPDIIGVVEGTDGKSVFLSTISQEIQVIPYSAIQHIMIETKIKWSDLS